MTMNSDDSIQLTLEEREHDEWFRAQIKEALDDPSPGIPHETIVRESKERIDRIAKRKRIDIDLLP